MAGADPSASKVKGSAGSGFGVGETLFGVLRFGAGFFFCAPKTGERGATVRARIRNGIGYRQIIERLVIVFVATCKREKTPLARRASGGPGPRDSRRGVQAFLQCGIGLGTERHRSFIMAARQLDELSDQAALALYSKFVRLGIVPPGAGDDSR